MKKFLIILLFNYCLANNYYPEKLADFSSIESFKDIYQKIYEDVHVENAENQKEIFKRMRQIDLDYQYKEEFTNNELTVLENLDVPEVFQKEDLIPLTRQIFTSKKLKNLYEQEKELLFLEQDIARRSALMGIFSDGKDNAPFDIIQDLNKIDEIFFGEEHTKPEPSFINNEEIKDQYWDDFDPEVDTDPTCWQDEREDSEICDNQEDEDYEPNTECITGLLASVVDETEGPLIELNSHPLAAQAVTATFFQPSNHEGTAATETGSLYASSATIPPNKKEEPEYLKILSENISDIFSSKNLKILSEVECVRSIKQKDRISALKETEKCAQEREKNFNKNLRDIYEDRELSK